MSIVYHASQNKNLVIIEPKKTLSNNVYIGDYVFATKNKLLAYMYLTTNGYPTLMNPGTNHPNIVICAKIDEYIKNDTGGAIYGLPSNNFMSSPQLELNEYEVVSKIAVVPLSKTEYSKTLDAMSAVGITIRFTDEKTFNKLLKSKKQLELVQNLDKYNI